MNNTESAAQSLPDPKGGCACTMHAQNAGGCYTEYVLEYEPACPEHSHHVYDPRVGAWIDRRPFDRAEASARAFDDPGL